MKLLSQEIKSSWGNTLEIIVDHENKIIYPIDLKTSGHPEEEFEDSFWHWGYYIQGQLYTYILQQNIQKDDYFKDFTIKPYQFIVINRRTLSPLIWTFYQSVDTYASLVADGNVYTNWRHIVWNLNEALKQPSSKYPPAYRSGKGVIKADIILE